MSGECRNECRTRVWRIAHAAQPILVQGGGRRAMKSRFGRRQNSRPFAARRAWVFKYVSRNALRTVCVREGVSKRGYKTFSEQNKPKKKQNCVTASAPTLSCTRDTAHSTRRYPGEHARRVRLAARGRWNAARGHFPLALTCPDAALDPTLCCGGGRADVATHFPCMVLASRRAHDLLQGAPELWGREQRRLWRSAGRCQNGILGCCARAVCG